jgi:uncharacterized membrane protein
MNFIDLISAAGYGIELMGVLVIIAGSAISSFNFIRSFRLKSQGDAFKLFRRQMAQSIILGLEFLIAGDIIRTVIVVSTFENVASLAVIILIRTFLNFTLHYEVEGHWPWQRDKITTS